MFYFSINKNRRLEVDNFNLCQSFDTESLGILSRLNDNTNLHR